MSSRIRVAILGATGSIGRQALDVIAREPERYDVVALVSGSDEDALRGVAEAHPTASVGLGGEAAVAAAGGDADVVLNAVVGAAGLRASLTALETGKTLALANKESLVTGGELCRSAAAAGGGTIVPVDSEHAALAQCLAGVSREDIATAWITASGGPFRTRDDLGSVTVDEALAHPTWSMGRKITVDSATLMNKGLEVIEARYLFDLELDRIGTVVHPQSVVHAMVELQDGSLVMQAAAADMRLPIAAALSHPARPQMAFSTLSLSAVGTLTFEDVDHDRFPCLGLAYDAARRGATFPAALNAANEVAVQAFLDERLLFTDIPAVVGDVVAAHEPGDPLQLDQVLAADAAARRHAESLVAGRLDPVQKAAR